MDGLVFNQAHKIKHTQKMNIKKIKTLGELKT